MQLVEAEAKYATERGAFPLKPTALWRSKYSKLLISRLLSRSNRSTPRLDLDLRRLATFVAAVHIAACKSMCSITGMIVASNIFPFNSLSGSQIARSHWCTASKLVRRIRLDAACKNVYWREFHFNVCSLQYFNDLALLQMHRQRREVEPGLGCQDGFMTDLS